MNLDHELLWRAIEGAIGAEKTAYLRHAPLDEIVLNKMARDYPDQQMPDRINIPDAMAHIAEKHAYAKRSWKLVEDGLESIRQLHRQGMYKRAYLLPAGPVEKKMAVRDRIVLAMSSPSGDRQKTAALLEEYDRQLAEFVGPDELEKLASKGLLKTVGQKAKDLAGTEVGKSALKGLGFAGGAAIPGAAVGHHMINKAEDRAKSMALPLGLAAGGGALLGGLGAGLGESLGDRALER